MRVAKAAATWKSRRPEGTQRSFNNNRVLPSNKAQEPGDVDAAECSLSTSRVTALARQNAGTAVNPPASRLNRQNVTAVPRMSFSSKRSRLRAESASAQVLRAEVYSVPVLGGRTTLSVTFDASGPHLLSWCTEGPPPDGFPLPMGSTCLYAWPQTTPVVQAFTRQSTRQGSNKSPTSRQGGSAPTPTPAAAEDLGKGQPKVVTPSAAGELVLREILLWLATHTTALESHDAVGAYPVHALAVCNTDASLELLMGVLKCKPHLLLDVHSASGPYAGETLLHVAAANRREELLLRLLSFASTSIERRELKALLRSQAAGAFFQQVPLCWFGGTALSFACVFGMRRAVRELVFGTGLVSLNAREDCCTTSGFLPIHAAVASGDPAMWDYLAGEGEDALPHSCCADARAVTAVGKAPGRQGFLPNLSALQLAARLGHHGMVRHILRRQCVVEWIWGPVTQFSLSLGGVDSSGEGGGDIMDLIVRPDASKRTTELLLDEFMNGFLNELYQAKWRLYGRRVHFIRLLVECVLLASLVIQSMWLKGWPSSSMASGGPQRLAVLHLVLVAISLEEEARTFYLYARNQQGDGDTRMRLTWLLSEVWAFMLQHSVHVLVLSHLFTLGGCAMLLIPGLLPDLDCAPGTDDWFSKWYNDQPNNSSSSSGCGVDAPSPASYGSRRQLKTSSASSAYSSGEVATFSSWQIIDEGAWGGLWFAQAFSLFLLVFYLAFVLSHAIDSLNTWLRTIHRMFIRDFSTYLCALFVILTAFYLALYLLFPRSGERSLPQSLDFNEWHTALVVMIDLAFLAERVPFEILPAAIPAMSSSQIFSFGAWVLLYYVFLIVSAVLMLNLLISIMAYTIEEEHGAAQLQTRLGFAIYVMKLELVAGSLGVRTRVGEYVPIRGNYEWKFKSYTDHRQRAGEDANDDGFDDSIWDPSTEIGFGDPFDPPPPIGVRSELQHMHSILRRLDARSRLPERVQRLGAWKTAATLPGSRVGEGRREQEHGVKDAHATVIAKPEYGKQDYKASEEEEEEEAELTEIPTLEL